MVYPASHVLVRAFGHFGTSSSAKSESWTCGWRIGGTPDLISEATLQAFADAVRPLFKTYFQTTNTGTGNASYFAGISCAQIGTDGHYTGGGSQETTYSLEATPTAGAGGVTMPYSTAYVVTLQGDRKRGLASQGRYYMPGGSLGFDNTGYVLAAYQTAHAAAAKTFINGMNAAAAANFVAGARLYIMSAVGAGAGQAVTSIRLDRRADAQERREKSLLPSYVETVL